MIVRLTHTARRASVSEADKGAAMDVLNRADLPFPNDVRRTPAGTTDFSGFPNPRRNSFIRRYVDAMTERERYRTRGLFYLATSDYNACVKEYGDLVNKYAGDASARNNLALCSSRLRKNAEAAEQVREVVRILL